MNYKHMILSALLLPFAINSYGKSVEARIKELQEAQFRKELELSEIGKIISEKDVFLNSFDEDSQYLLRLLINRKKTELIAKNGGIKLSKEEEKKLGEELRNSVNEFLYAVCAAYKAQKNVADIIKNGIFQEDSSNDLKELESLKFFLIRSAFERELVIKFVDKYSVCIQELIKINQELAKLNK